MKQGIANRKLPKAGSSRDSKPRREFSLTKANQEGRKSAVPVFLVIAVVVCLVVIGIVKAGKTDRNAWMQSPTQSTSLGSSSANHDDKWKDLNGKSMGKWMQENKVDSQMARERQQRLQQHQSGRQP